MYFGEHFESVTKHRGKGRADFVTLDWSFNILPVNCHEKNVGTCMNVNLCNNVEKVKGQPNEFFEENKTCNDFRTFKSYFDFAQKNVSDVQFNMLQKCLYQYWDIFYTKENPSLGFTSLVEHTIHLQPNAVSKHHKPYRLSPDKREVLGTQ